MSNVNQWNYTVVHLPAQDSPATHAAFLECRDTLGNYRGIELGRDFRSATEAENACEYDRSTRTDWRTATEIDQS